MPVIIPDWYGPDWIREALRDEDIMLAGAAPGFSGAFTLFGQPAAPAALVNDVSAYTLGIEFSSSQAGQLTGIWFYSAPGAGILAGTIALFAVAGQSLVHSELAAWSGAAGSGWVRAPFAAPPAVSAGVSYKAAFLNGDGLHNWYSDTSHDWDTGAHAAGAAHGPLSAPNNAGGDGGQDTFNAGNVLGYPASSFNAGNYWLDPEITV